jgi:transcriptional regulator with XRE-family HTH domain
MDIGGRLRELRQAKGFSQDDIEKRTGIKHSYISRVENGHAIPSLETLERFARGLNVELYQLFFVGHAEPEAPQVATETPAPSLPPEEDALLRFFGRMSKPNRTLLVALARKMAATKRQK